MKKKTQKDRVAEILKTQGYIDNLFCVETKLSLRLGAIIHSLKADGFEFDEVRSGFLEGTKNYRYYLLNAPKPPVRPRQMVEQLPDGSVRVYYV